MRTFIVLVSLMTCSLCQEPPRIRVDVNLVNVAFTARDTQGALAAGLTQDDFEVFEDAILQKISFFARSASVPLTLGLIVDASGSRNISSRRTGATWRHSYTRCCGRRIVHFWFASGITCGW